MFLIVLKADKKLDEIPTRESTPEPAEKQQQM